MRPFTVFTTLIILSTVASAFAPEAQQPSAPPLGGVQALRPIIRRALTLQEAVEIALKESPVVRGAEEEVNMAIAQVGMAKADPRPIVSTTSFLTTGSLGNVFTTPEGVMPRMIMPAPRSSFFDQNLMLMYPLYTSGRLQALIRQAQAAKSASDADLGAARRDLALEVKTAYRQVLLAQAVTDIFKALSDTTQERLRIDRVAFDEGRIPRFYVLRDEAEHANAQQMLVNAQRDVDVTLVMLKTVMGVSQASQITLSEKLSYESVKYTREELLTLAEKQRPELVAAQQRVEAAQQGIAVARSTYKPQLSLMAMADAMKAKGMGSTAGTTFGVVLGLPVLDGGMRRAQVNEASASLRKAQQDYEKVALQVIKDVETAFLALQAAERNIKTAETVLVSAEEDYRVAQLRYTEGRGINVEVLDALTTRTRARTNHVQALYDYNVARDQLIRAIGQQ
jgi:outer membrane protein TolC